jgi:hypothetical protein
MDELRESVENLNRRLDQLSGELEGLRQAQGRAPGVSPQTVAPQTPTEEEFRAQHERTILSVIADERDRIAFESTCSTIRGAVKEFCHENHVPDDKQAAVVISLIEGQKRAAAILRQYAPDGKGPVEGDSVRKEWERAWDDLRAWRHAQLSRSLDAVQEEQLLSNLLGTLKY